MTPLRLRDGFTLLELLTVMVLMGVATTLGITMLFKVSDTWRETARYTELEEQANRVFDEMRQDFASLASFTLYGTAIRGVPRNASDARYAGVVIEDDTVILPAILALKPNEAPQRVDVAYRISRENGQCILLRSVRVPGVAETPVKVADGIVAMRIEYQEQSSDGTWQAGWNKPGHPSSVRVNLTLEDPIRNNEQVSRQAAFPIRVE